MCHCDFFCGGWRGGVSDGEPGIIQLSSGLGQLQAEEAADGLFEGRDGLVSLLGGSLFPGDFEPFESSAEFQSLSLSEGGVGESGQECAAKYGEEDCAW